MARLESIKKLYLIDSDADLPMVDRTSEKIPVGSTALNPHNGKLWYWTGHGSDVSAGSGVPESNGTWVPLGAEANDARADAMVFLLSRLDEKFDLLLAHVAGGLSSP